VHVADNPGYVDRAKELNKELETALVEHEIDQVDDAAPPPKKRKA